MQTTVVSAPAWNPQPPPETDAGVELVLAVSDPEVRAELEAFSDLRERTEFALDALKVGVVALRQVRGRVEADRLRTEGERLIETLNGALENSRRQLSQDLSSSLKDYFDPRSGRLTERIERLVKRDGDLEQVLRRHVSGDDSELARTLGEQIGPGSALARLLDSSSSDGILASFNRELAKELTAQRERIIHEFSLDNGESALSRLVRELTERHGELGQALEKRIDDVVAEFSLDRDDSALSRLVARVERAQLQISSEFSLDQEQSALARVRRELLSVIDAQRDTTERFQRAVLEKLAAMSARREEASRSTRHGNAFEEQVFEFLQLQSQRAGDIATHVGNTVGLIKNCKVGDAVVTLGPEQAAAGARLAVEAKEREGFGLTEALELIETARKNREASVGLFVFSSRNAPNGLEPFARYGNDVVVLWDAEDQATDVVLLAGLSVARALAVRAKVERDAEAADFLAIDAAVREIERQIGGLDEIAKLTGTIQANSEKVIKRADLMRRSLLDQVGTLDRRINDLRAVSTGGPQ